MLGQSVICIASPKGGTGKSTIAKELALHMSKKTSTCLIDLDISHGALNALFKILPSATIVDWFRDYHRYKSTIPLADLSDIYTWDKIQEYLVLAPNSTLHILPAPIVGDSREINEVDLETLIYYLKKYFTCIILDTGSNLEPQTRAALSLSDQFFLIATDDNTCINSLQKFRRQIHLNHWGEHKFNLIINQQPKSPLATYSFTELEALLQFRMLAVLPDTDEVWMLNNAGISLTETSSNALRKGLLQFFSSPECVI